MNSIVRLLGAAATALAALNAFLLGWPGDVVAQETMLLIGALNAGLTAMVVYLAKPVE